MTSTPPTSAPPPEVDSQVLSFLAKTLRRALVPMFMLALSGIVTALATVVGTIYLVMSLSRVETIAIKLEELTRSVERVERTATSTETKIDETQETIEKQPTIDFEVHTASASARASAKPTTFVVVRPRKPPPAVSASAAPAASVEIKLPLPSAEPEKKP